MSIYMEVKELEEKYIEYFEKLQENEEESLQEDYKALCNEVTEAGIEKLCKWLKATESDTEGLKKEIDRLTQKKKSCDNKIEFIKGYIKYLYERAEKDSKGRVFAGTFTVNTRTSKAVVIPEDLSLIPEEYKRIKEEADKKAIKEALERGEVIDYCSIEERKNLTIK